MPWRHRPGATVQSPPTRHPALNRAGARLPAGATPGLPRAPGCPRGYPVLPAGSTICRRESVLGGGKRGPGLVTSRNNNITGGPPIDFRALFVLFHPPALLSQQIDVDSFSLSLSLSFSLNNMMVIESRTCPFIRFYSAINTFLIAGALINKGGCIHYILGRTSLSKYRASHNNRFLCCCFFCFHPSSSPLPPPPPIQKKWCQFRISRTSPWRREMALEPMTSSPARLARAHRARCAPPTEPEGATRQV